MAVYVDEVFSWPVQNTAGAARAVARKTGGRWCHMTADSEAELLRFAAKLGLKRAWAQGLGTRRVHFDLTPKKRAQALAAGATFRSAREWVRAQNKDMRVTAQPTKTEALTFGKPTTEIPSPLPLVVQQETTASNILSNRPRSPYD